MGFVVAYTYIAAALISLNSIYVLKKSKQMLALEAFLFNDNSRCKLHFWITS